jgi:ABC-type antimicrobial peptide transport system permease subunit
MLRAIIGIYGVASYAITQRRHEIGVRIAVGAPSQSVRAMLARQGMTPVAIGTVAGVCAAIALRRFLEHLLDTGGETGAQPFLAAAVVLALVAGATSWFATRRVTRMNPIEILRSE